MKKIFAFFLSAILVLSPVFASSQAVITINGKNAEIPNGMGEVKTVQSRTFVPVRFLLEYFNYDVSWNGKDMTVLGYNQTGGLFVLQVENRLLSYSSDGKRMENVTMDVAPFLDSKEERVYIPLRFLAEAIGYNVGYNEVSKTVILTKK